MDMWTHNNGYWSAENPHSSFYDVITEADRVAEVAAAQ
jgi:hypothetical protein